MISNSIINNEEDYEYLPIKLGYFVEANLKLESNPTSNIGLYKAIPIIKEDIKSDKSRMGEYRPFLRALTEAGLSMWQKIPMGEIGYFPQAFNMTELTVEQAQPILDTIHQLLLEQNYKHASQMIEAFCLRHHFKCDEIVAILAAQGCVDKALSLASNDPHLCGVLVKCLNVQKYSKEMSKLIITANLNPNDFPELISHQRYAALRSFVSRHDWMKGEELAVKYPEGLHLLVKILIKANQFEEALSIIQRNCLTVSDNISNTIAQKCPVPKKLENTLLVEDYFGPTEVLLNKADPTTYLLLSDFGIKEEDVHFVDSEKHPQFESSISHFLAASVVGCDSEFGGKMTSFEHHKVATLQLSTEEFNIVYDCVALSASKPFIDFLHSFFESSIIEKIGHTFTSDISCLNLTFGTTFV